MVAEVRGNDLARRARRPPGGGPRRAPGHPGRPGAGAGIRHRGHPGRPARRLPPDRAALRGHRRPPPPGTGSAAPAATPIRVTGTRLSARRGALHARLAPQRREAQPGLARPRPRRRGRRDPAHDVRRARRSHPAPAPRHRRVLRPGLLPHRRLGQHPAGRHDRRPGDGAPPRRYAGPRGPPGSGPAGRWTAVDDPATGTVRPRSTAPDRLTVGRAHPRPRASSRWPRPGCRPGCRHWSPRPLPPDLASGRFTGVGLDAEDQAARAGRRAAAGARVAARHRRGEPRRRRAGSRRLARRHDPGLVRRRRPRAAGPHHGGAGRATASPSPAARRSTDTRRTYDESRPRGACSSRSSSASPRS